MSLLSGLFTIPFSAAYQIYAHAYYELPLENDLWERIYKSDPRYSALLQTIPGSDIKASMQPFLDAIEVRKDIIFSKTINRGICATVGTNICTNGDAVIFVQPGFYECDRNACSFLIKHEISHIKYNDLLTMHFVPFICQLAASIFGMCFLSFWPALGLALSLGILTRSLFSQWREAKADDFAIEHSSTEELIGGRRLWTALQQVYSEARNTFWKRILTSPEGNARWDIWHPSLSSRIQKIERSLRARNVEIRVDEEQKALDATLTQFMAKAILEITQLIERTSWAYVPA